MAEATEDTRPQIKEIDRFTMFAKASESQQRSSRLAWCVRDKNPRITVYTNINEDPVANKVIYAAMNPETFFIFLDLFEKLAKGEPGRQAKINCYTSFNPEGGNGSAVGEKTLLSEVHFGKDENGIVWLKLVARNRPEIKFEYHLSDYHEIFKTDGSQVTKAEASQMQANATIGALKGVYSALVGDFRVSKPQTAGGSYRPAQSNYSNQQKSNDNLFDDDVSF